MEYINLSYAERVHGRKELLQAEITTLECVRYARNYKKLRAQELALKTELRVKMNAMAQKLKEIESWMPKTQTSKEKGKTEQISIKKRKDLELEINTLREKLAILSSE